MRHDSLQRPQTDTGRYFVTAGSIPRKCYRPPDSVTLSGHGSYCGIPFRVKCNVYDEFGLAHIDDRFGIPFVEKKLVMKRRGVGVPSGLASVFQFLDDSFASGQPRRLYCRQHLTCKNFLSSGNVFDPLATCVSETVATNGGSCDDR